MTVIIIVEGRRYQLMASKFSDYKFLNNTKSRNKMSDIILNQYRDLKQQHDKNITTSLTNRQNYRSSLKTRLKMSNTQNSSIYYRSVSRKCWYFNYSRRRRCLKRHYHHLHRHHHSIKCSLCAPGQFVQSWCNGSHVTRCTACPPNTYNSHNTDRIECKPCSQCGDSLFISHECTARSDTICDSCFNQRSTPYPADYELKCSQKKSLRSELQNL